TPTPDTPIAILVAGEILEVRFHHLAVRVGRIFQRRVRAEGQVEGIVFVDVAVDQETVEVGMGYVIPEFTQGSTAWPGVEAVFRAQEGAIRVLRQGKPEAGLIGTGGHVTHKGI